ncbi:chromatin assembly factor 1 subunit A-like [Phlebotomus argentipes]|uniref:chromatin assembly factor 1 subunit A-like n=1 Tax=Phlebotomus argentipes TaxID=94469 RepID=UPI0028932006|nr:chromatin assembly factor 1 subunit A-like [Phlebotomus argentipes]
MEQHVDDKSSLSASASDHETMESWTFVDESKSAAKQTEATGSADCQPEKAEAKTDKYHLGVDPDNDTELSDGISIISDSECGGRHSPEEPHSEAEKEEPPLLLVPEKRLVEVEKEPDLVRGVFGIGRRHVVFVILLAGISGAMFGHIFRAMPSAPCDCSKLLEPLMNRVYDLEMENFRLRDEVSKLTEKILSEALKASVEEPMKPVTEEPVSPVEKVWAGNTDEAIVKPLVEESVCGGDSGDDLFDEYYGKVCREAEKRVKEARKAFEEKPRQPERTERPERFREERKPEKKERNSEERKGKPGKYQDRDDRKNSKEDRKNSKERSDERRKRDDDDDDDDDWSGEDYRKKREKYEKKKKGERKDDDRRSSKERWNGEKKWDKKNGKKWRDDDDDDDDDSREERRSKEVDAEWHNKRMKGREQFREKESGEKDSNWYLERGSDREIKRLRVEESHERRLSRVFSRVSQLPKSEMPGDQAKTSAEVSPNVGKKLVQTRLPFKVLSPGAGNKPEGVSKRKLSSPAIDNRALKVPKKTDDEESEHEEFSNPDTIIVIHDEKSQEKANRKDDVQDKIEESDEQDEEDKKILIKFPFAKKDNNEVKAEPKKPKEKRKRSKKTSKKNEVPEKDVQEAVNIEDEDIVMICDEKLSMSMDGDNNAGSVVDTPPRKRVKEEENGSSSEDAPKKLTPRQVEKQQEMEKRRQERLADKLNRKKKQEEEKELKKKEKEEKEEQRRKEKEEKDEQKRKEKEEKDEQKRKEKEEKEKKRQAELDAKNEEKRMKEEEKRQKDEEKRKKEEEKKEAARRVSDNFKKFFMLKSKPQISPSASDADKENCSDDIKSSGPKFMPFCVKPDMRLAPSSRRNLKDDEKSRLDHILSKSPEEKEKLYLKEIGAEGNCARKSGRTWIQEEDSDDEVILLSDEGQRIEENKPKIKYRVKFLRFHENQRPPYYGTWRKKSAKLTPRNPFSKDENLFDYEVDSDDEWEEEEPGESLHGSDDEKDKESEDDYEVDNDFFVPHGHLSDEELQNEDEDNSPEMQKAKLKLLQQEFADEMKKKTEKLKPRLIGCVWQTASGERPDSCSEVIWRLLSASKMLFCGPVVLNVEPTSSTTTPSKEEEGAESAVKKRKKLHEEDVKSLIRLAHGNSHSGRFLVEEFVATRAKEKEGQEDKVEVTKIGVKRKLREVAEWKVCPEAGAMEGKMCWYVAPKVREQFGLGDLTLPNTWKYTLTPKKVEEAPVQAPPVPPQKEEQPEKQKKRMAPLMSVPRGQAFSPSTKNQLISQFLKKTKPEDKTPVEVIELD